MANDTWIKVGNEPGDNGRIIWYNTETERYWKSGYDIDPRNTGTKNLYGISETRVRQLFSEDNWNLLSAPWETDDVKIPGGGGIGLDLGSTFNIAGGGENVLETFFKNVPGLRDFLAWYYSEAKDTILRQRTEWPFETTIEEPKDEGMLLDMLRERVTAGRGLTPPPTDLAKYFEGAYEKRLPNLELRQKEEKDKTDEQLAALGLSGSSAGFSVDAELSERFAAQKEELGFQANIGLAQAKESDWQRLSGFEQLTYANEDSDINALFTMLARTEERQRRNIEQKISEEMMMRGLPAMVSLGQPTAASGLQAATSVYNTGVSSTASMNNAAMSAGAQVASANIGAQADMWGRVFDAQQMAPFIKDALNMDTGGGGKK